MPAAEASFSENAPIFVSKAQDRRRPAEERARSGERRRKWQIGAFLVVVVQTSTEMWAGPDRRESAEGDGWVVRISRGRSPAPGRADEARQSAFLKVALRPAHEFPGAEASAADRVAVIVPQAASPELDAAFLAHGNGEIVGPRARMLGIFLLSIADFLPNAAQGDLPRLGDALQGMLLATLLRGGANLRSVQGGSKAHLRSQVDGVIARNIGSARLDAARIAKLAGVSRASLYRLFEGCGGVAAHVRRLRLERVRADLCDPAQGSVAIAALAERSGLHSVASFNRSFRLIYGTTPGKMRMAALAPGALAHAPGSPSAAPACEPAQARGRRDRCKARAARKVPIAPAPPDAQRGGAQDDVVPVLPLPTSKAGPAANLETGAVRA